MRRERTQTVESMGHAPATRPNSWSGKYFLPWQCEMGATGTLKTDTCQEHSVCIVRLANKRKPGQLFLRKNTTGAMTLRSLGVDVLLVNTKLSPRLQY